MSQRELKLLIAEKAEEIAEVLLKGKDCEIRKSKDGISIAEISKKIIIKS